MSATSEIIAGVGSWAVCSVGMLIFNKQAVTVFPLAASLVLLQLVFSAAFMLLCWKSLHIGSAKDLFRWLLVVPFFSGMLLTSMFALSSASMTTVITFRAVSPLVSMTVERFYPSPLRVTPKMILCILIMIIGAVVYARAMGSSEYSALGWLLLNNFFAIGDRLLQRLMLAKDQNPVDMSKAAITLVNNAAGAIPIGIAAYLHGELQELPGTVASLSHSSWCILLASCLVSVGISYTGIWAQSLITATTFLVLINANKFFIVFLEAYVLKTKSLSVVQIAGASIVVLASAAYGKAREEAEAEAKLEGAPLLAKSPKV
jgi:drug/metabolite transporter (DMT)-like permease